MCHCLGSVRTKARPKCQSLNKKTVTGALHDLLTNVNGCAIRLLAWSAVSSFGGQACFGLDDVRRLRTYFELEQAFLHSTARGQWHTTFGGVAAHRCLSLRERGYFRGAKGNNQAPSRSASHIIVNVAALSKKCTKIEGRTRLVRWYK